MSNEATNIILDNCFCWWETLTEEQKKDIILEAFAKKNKIVIE